MQVGAVILAAGASSRMGCVKQTLLFRAKTLVENAIENAQRAGFEPLVVVLGAHAEAVGQAVAFTTAQTILNEDWQSGMGSSISAGVGKMLQLAPELEALAVLLVDQPLVTADHLKEMGRLLIENGAPIVAASYSGTVGVPAIFHHSQFAKLRNLAPTAGARMLLRGGDRELRRYDLPEAASDVDTPEDFAALG